jgi:hypothetical protein
MSEKWYYVLAGERQGPVGFEKVNDLYTDGSLTSEDYVWRKGLENWIKIKDASDFKVQETNNEIEVENIPEAISESLNLSEYNKDEKIFYIKTGADRGQAETEYGPFSLSLLKKLYEENRINAKTFIFTKGLGNWSVLGEASGFEQVFEQMPPAIEEADKRAFKRKPFIARMFIQNNKNVFEGICRDVSVGGMQVLVDNFPGAVGEKISINVHPENTEHHFVAAGQIVRVLEGGHGFSFRFNNLSPDATNAINSYISDE